MQVVEVASVRDEEGVGLKRSNEAAPCPSSGRLTRTGSVTFFAPAVDRNLLAFHHVCHVHLRVDLAGEEGRKGVIEDGVICDGGVG